MEGRQNSELYDESEILFSDKVRKKNKQSRKSSIEKSFSKLSSLQIKEKPTTYKLLFKFYLILLVQQLFGFIFCYAGTKILPLSIFIKQNKLIFLLFFITCSLLSLLSYFFKKPFRLSPYNYTILIIYSVLYSYVIAYICLSIEKHTMMMAIFTTFVIIATLQIYVSTKQLDFSVISSVFIVLVVGGFHYFFYKIYTSTIRLRVLLSLCWVLVWGMYLVYWTWKIIKKVYKFKNKDYILIAFRFYILILFIYSMVYGMKYQVIQLFEKIEYDF